MLTKNIMAQLASTVALLALITGCAGGALPASEATSTNEQSIDIVASTTQLCDYVTHIAGNEDGHGLTVSVTRADGTRTEHATSPNASARINLTCLLAPNASAHEHEMTPQQATALAEADLFLVNGVDLEHFLDNAVESTGFHGTMVVTSGVLGAKDIDSPNNVNESNLPYTIDRGIDKVDVKPWPFPPGDGETEAEFRFDPHVWTSPKNAIIQVKNIGNALEKASPGNADTLKAHVDAYIAQLKELDAWADASLKTVPTAHRVLFTSHDAFGYFSAAYDVKFMGAALSDFNAQQDATAAKIQETIDAVKNSGAVAIFAENSNNSKSIEKIASLAGVKAVIGDEALYGDSLGEPGSEGETYIGSIIHNVTTLVGTLGGTLQTIPAEIVATAH